MGFGYNLVSVSGKIGGSLMKYLTWILVVFAILLSPGLDYRGVTTENRLADYGERPLLIVASEDDNYSANSSRTMAETAVGETQVKIYEKAGHGTNMFAPQPDLTPLIVEWLAQHLAN
jgi:alpha-beta hydrolase superfamily lysophospholipase